MKSNSIDMLLKVLETVDQIDNDKVRLSLASATLVQLAPAIHKLIGHIKLYEQGSKEDNEAKATIAITGLSMGVLVRLLMKKEDMAKTFGEGSSFSSDTQELMKKFCSETEKPDDSGATIAGAM